MGTDIHVAVEALDDDNTWCTVPGRIEICYCCKGEPGYELSTGEPCFCVTETGEDQEDEADAEHERTTYVGEGRTRCSWYHDRNYNVFAALAGVRNGTAFAGSVTGDPIIPIAEPRGLPDDMDPASRAYLSFQHSASWLLLSEIRSYDWDQIIRKQGVVDEDEFEAVLQKGQPESWSADVMGGMVRKISNNEMTALRSGRMEREEGISYYTTVSWYQPLRESTEGFLEAMNDLLWQKFRVGRRDVTNKQLERVRLVFDFDS